MQGDLPLEGWALPPFKASLVPLTAPSAERREAQEGSSRPRLVLPSRLSALPADSSKAFWEGGCAF